VTVVLGVDVGATKIAAAVVDPLTGSVERRASIATEPGRGGRAVLADCVSLAERVGADTPVDAIGIGVCELVDLDGAVTSAHSFDWRALDVAGAFSHLGRAHVDSDVRVAALAEARCGAGGDFRSFLYVNAGSGISSCFVLDGLAYAGARGNAIAIGAGPLNVEELSGGTAISKRLGVAPGELARCAAAGEHATQSAFEEGGRALGAAIAFAVNLLDPEGVVLGGGIVSGSSLYRAALETELRAQVYAEDTRRLPVVAGRLGGDAGVVGAALGAAAVVAGAAA